MFPPFPSVLARAGVYLEVGSRQPDDLTTCSDIDLMSHNREGVLLDCEPAHWTGRGYELADTPPGSCPDPLEGHLEGLSLRCNSWEAILWDYFYYAGEVPASMWPAKHVQSYALVCAAMGKRDVDRLRQVFAAKYAA